MHAEPDAVHSVPGTAPRTAGPAQVGLVEVRTYALLPGSGNAFHRLMQDESVPMLRRAGIRVLFHGPAEQAPDRYILVRGFRDEQDRSQTLGRFYSSPEWLTDLDGRIMALIDAYHAVAVTCSPEWQTAIQTAEQTQG